MKVFLSYKYGDDVQPLINYLSELNIGVFDTLTDITAGVAWNDAITEAIKESDFLIAVYSQANTTTAYEVGVANAINKPVFTIIDGDWEEPFLRATPYIRARPNEINKIKPIVGLFIKKLSTSKSATKVSQKIIYYGGGEAIPDKKLFDAEAEYLNLDKKDGRNLERLFNNLFRAYMVKVVEKPIESEHIADFIIWYEPLSDILGNPITIEVKNRLDSTNYKKFIESIYTIRARSGGASMIVFYDGLAHINKHELPSTPDCLFIEIASFVRALSGKTFSEAVRKFRNDLIHNKNY